MKHYLQQTIQVLASLLVMVLGTTQAAQAENIWLDFSVEGNPQEVLAPSGSEASSVPLNTPPLGASGGHATTLQVAVTQSPIALDFGVPNAGSSLKPMADVSGTFEPVPLPLKPTLAKEPPTALPGEPPTAMNAIAQTRTQQLTALRRAIIGQESAGKFNIVNPHSGALGYGQVMPANVALWSQAAVGRAVSTAEFLNDPNLQIKVIDHKLGQYFNRALQITQGDEATAVKRVAALWYSGNPNLHTSTRPQFYKGHLYPSIAAYCQSVLRRYQQSSSPAPPLNP